MRIQLDIPLSEEPGALPLLAMRERVLRVTVEPEASQEGLADAEAVEVSEVSWWNEVGVGRVRSRE